MGILDKYRRRQVQPAPAEPVKALEVRPKRKKKRPDFYAFAKAIHRRTGYAQEIFEVADRIAKGELEGTEPRDMLAAMKFIAEYAWVKPAEKIEVAGPGGAPIAHAHAHLHRGSIVHAVVEGLPDPGRASDADLDALAAVLDRMSRPPENRPVVVQGVIDVLVEPEAPDVKPDVHE